MNEEKEIVPPEIALRILSWFCPPRLYEEIEGDLIQNFFTEVHIYGRRKARRRMIWSAVRFFRSGILLRNRFSGHSNQLGMLNHFFKIFFRTALKSKAYSLMNISGLAVGLACSIFALLWVTDEFSFDTFHRDKERILSVWTNSINADGINTVADTPGRLAEALREFPEVETSARTIEARHLFAYRDKSIYEKGIFADASFFNVFTFPLVEGNVNDPLPGANSIVICETLALKYFKTESALGKIIRINNTEDVQVSAVIRDLPFQSTQQFQYILPYAIYAKNDQYNQEWGAWTGGNTYVKLHAGFDRMALEKKIADKITHPRIWPRWGDSVELFLFPLNDWHLRNNFENGRQSGGRIVYVQAFGIVALFILLMACVNFMNLATARSLNRSKEIGVRKVIGAVRHALTRLFLGESILLAFIALFVALVMVYLALPYFNELTNKKITLPFANPAILLQILGVTLLAGILAGLYPALFLSSLRVIQVLKNNIAGMGAAGVRKALVVFQFSLSVIMIIGSLVVYQQIDYMRNKDLGFDKQNVFYLSNSRGFRKNFNTFRQQALANSHIRHVSRANAEPMNMQNGLEMADDAWPGKTKADNVLFQWLFCDQEFLEAFSFDVIKGRAFSPDSADADNIIITEMAARSMKLSDPIGQTVKIDRAGKVIGIIRDFHSQGLDQKIQPVIISLRPARTDRIFIHYEQGYAQEAMGHIQSVYKELVPDFPMEYTFLDDTFDEQYKNELLMKKLSTCFTIIALFISCLGLFGLASFTAERRIKEIGIRKIMGATVLQLIRLLCIDFVMLVGIALIIGIPVAWWGSDRFLETYAFRVNVGISVFAITTVSLFTLALFTVSFQAARAALSDPVKNLRTE